jgi:uncharacterized protein
MSTINRDELVCLTQQYGGAWGLNHTRRLLELVSSIGAGLEYDADIVWIAAYLHDWGAYPPWAKEGVDHAVRSGEVAAEFLAKRGYPAARIVHIVECIVSHHSVMSDHSIEALLLRDADALDFLGIVGMARDFAKKPKELKDGYESVKRRRQRLPGVLYLPKAREIAQERVREMDEAIAAFERETFGCF